MQGISSAGQKPSAGGSSFLDEWLAKRQQLGGKPAVNPVTKPSGVQISSSAQQVSGSVGSISNTPSVAAPVGNPISLQNKDSEREIATVNTNRLPSTVEPSRPVVKNRLDLRSSDNDDNEVTINLR